MSASIRGHQGQLKLFKDGALLNVVNITNVDINQDASFSRSKYVGQAIHEGDMSIEGYSGSIDCEVKDAAIEDLVDAIVTDNLNGIGASEYTFVSTENYPDGTSRSYVYFDVQMKYSKKNPASDAKITKRLDFQAAGRLKL